MSVLITSDVHIDSYFPYSTISDGGIPSRLLCFNTLAEMIKDKAKENKVTDIIIAGDIANSAINSPMVNNRIGDFLGELATVAQVYVIHGNHDWDGKSYNRKEKDASLLWIYEKIPGINYMSNCTDRIDGETVYFRGWKEHFNLSKFAKTCSVLIAHGFVEGAKVPNYGKADMGFDPRELSKTFKFSAVGDIHKGQLLYRNVLIPGCPIQSSYKDDPKTGIWIVKNWESVRFIPLDHPSFHKFFSVKNDDTRKEIEAEQESIRNNGTLHIDYAKNPSKKDNKEEFEIQSKNTNLKELIQQVLANKKIADPDNMVKKKTIRLLKESSGKESPNYSYKNLRLRNISISNFRSIHHLEINFMERGFPLLFLGESGKSVV